MLFFSATKSKSGAKAKRIHHSGGRMWRRVCTNHPTTVATIASGMWRKDL
ncbi:hypothetical protein MtrunA17_Chr5g0427641 [Medicago truncatula]|uniref:Uncharacterized protein n=1 Tax=Medicago truncatula TaxID=3880 RepID=A0A396HSF7_MEDTR|nr:hypothetical protein MtrunA17_Chr5g0427641 [Medicago truncatula]